MGNDGANAEPADAQAMLDAFASVGATRFDVTWTTKAGGQERFQRGVCLVDLTRTMPAMLDSTTRRQINLIIRPRGEGVTFIQLDDLKSAQITAVAPAVFLALKTSPGNFQAWVALSATEDKDFARRLRKGIGADATASGATRVAGSFNFKDKYAPAFPRVVIHAAQPGRLTTTTELEQRGLVAAPETVTVPSPGIIPARARPGPGIRKWPSYARCLDGAPLNSEETGPDTSRADFVWCMTAITWGWSAQEAAERLMEESNKAQVNGRIYADLTARNAALAVERRRQQPKRHRMG